MVTNYFIVFGKTRKTSPPQLADCASRSEHPRITPPGYVYIYLSNEEPTGTPIEVYFACPSGASVSDVQADFQSALNQSNYGAIKGMKNGQSVIIKRNELMKFPLVVFIILASMASCKTEVVRFVTENKGSVSLLVDDIVSMDSTNCIINLTVDASVRLKQVDPNHTDVFVVDEPGDWQTISMLRARGSDRTGVLNGIFFDNGTFFFYSDNSILVEGEIWKRLVLTHDIPIQ